MSEDDKTTGTGQEALPIKAEPMPTQVQAPLGLDPRVLTAHIRQALEARRDVLRMLLSPGFLGPDAFLNEGGKPWLPGAKAQRVAGPAGICVEPNCKPESGEYNFQCIDGTDDDPDEPRYFEIRIEGRAWHVGQPQRVVSEMGKAASRDPFYRRKRKGEDKARRQPLEAMSKGDVCKKALMNLWARAVQGLLGIKGLTWKELEELGHKESKAQRIEFRDGGARGQGAPREEPPQDDEGDAEIKKRLSGMILAMVGWKKGMPLDEEIQALAAGELEVLSRFKDKKTGEDVSVSSMDDRRLRGKWLRAIYGKCRRKFEGLPRERQETAGEQPGLWDLPPEFDE